MTEVTVPQIPLWEALLPPDHLMDQGRNSCQMGRLAEFLRGHPEFCHLTVQDSHPLDWTKVYAVLGIVHLPKGRDNNLLRVVSRRIGRYIGVFPQRRRCLGEVLETIQSRQEKADA